jgi:hypothetical protein
MRNRIKGTLPLLAAASLLGSAAFAECPAFQAGNPMPTVVISDNDTSGNPDAGGPNLFEYLNAFDLIDYIDLGSVTSNPDQDARWNYAEFAVGGTTPEGASGDYTINGNLGVTTVPTTAAGLDTGSYSAVSQGVLSFRNIFLSPVGGPFIAPGVGDTPNQKTMTIFLIAPSTSSACFLDANIDVASFSILTEAGTLDHLSPPLCSWTPFYDVNGDFGSTTTPGSVAPVAEWNFLITNGGAYTPDTTPPGNAQAGGSFGTHAVAGTTAVGMHGTVGSAVGLASWGFTTDDLIQDRIYRCRITLSSNKGPASASAWWRARMGGSFFTYHGNAEEGFDHNSQSMPNSATGAVTLEMLMWIKTSTPALGFAAAGNFTGDAPFLIVDFIDFFTDAGSEVDMVSDVIIDSTTRDCLGTGTVMYNYGRASISAVEDYNPPATGLTAFNVDGGATGWGAIKLPGFGDTNVTFTGSNGSGGAMNVAWTTVGTPGVNDFGAGVVGSFNLATTGFNADNNTVYSIDAWLSPNISPNNSTSRMPVLRLRFSGNEGGGGNVHRNQFHTQWHLSPDTNFDGNTLDGSGVPENLSALTTAGVARHYASFWQPDLNTNVGTGGNANTSYFVFGDFLWNRQAGLNIRPQGTIVIERFLVQSYPDWTF